MKKFLDLSPVPEYTSESADMLVMSKWAWHFSVDTNIVRDAYVNMKAKEKGIDQKTLYRGTPSTDTGTPGPSEKGFSATSSGQKFNAFREMDKLRKGGVPQLARIPDSVAVVGKPMSGYDKSKKRDREEDEEDRPGKAAKPQVGLKPCAMMGTNAL